MAAKKPPRPGGKRPSQIREQQRQPRPAASGISAAATGGAALAAGATDEPAAAGISSGAIAGAAAGAQDAAPSESQESHVGIDPAAEHDYWRAHYHQRPYVAAEKVGYEQLAPAYQHGWEGFARYGRTATGEPAKFEDIEPQLRQDWQAQQRDEQIAWELAQQATRDAWDRVQAALAGEADKPSAR